MAGFFRKRKPLKKEIVEKSKKTKNRKNRNRISEKFGKKFTKKNTISLRKLFSRRSLLGRNVVAFVAMAVVAMLAVSFFTFLVTIENVTKDFKSAANNALGQNQEYVQLINDIAEQTGYQLLTNQTITNGISYKGNDFWESINAMADAKKALMGIQGINSDSIIDSIFIYKLSEDVYISTGNDRVGADSTEYAKKIKETEWFKRAIQKGTTSFWAITDVDGKKQISFIRLITNTLTLKPIGVAQINISNNVFDRAMAKLKIGENGKVYILNDNGQVVGGNSEKALGQDAKMPFFKDIKDSASGSLETKIDGKSYYVVYSSMDKIGWKYIALVPTIEIYKTPIKIGEYLIGIFFVCLFIAAVFSVFISLQITNPITNFIGLTKKVSECDFTANSNKKYKVKELNELSENFNNMINVLKEAVSNTSAMAEETACTSADLLELSNSLYKKSEDVVRSVNEIAIGSSKQAADTLNCAEINNTLNKEISSTLTLLEQLEVSKQQAIEAIKRSTEEINELNSTSLDNSTSMDNVAKTINELNGNTSMILKILNQINDITNQTNLLSLNASIEAARAGEAGRGFSVVANEIRMLAEQSQKASLEIKQIIDGVNNSIKNSLSIADNAKLAFIKEQQQVQNTINSFNSLEKSFREVSNAVEKAMASVKTIDANKVFLSDAINNISAVSQQNTAATEEVTAVIQDEVEENKIINEIAEGLNKKAENLKEIVERFKF